MGLGRYITEDTIVFLTSSDKRDAIHTLVARAASLSLLRCSKEFEKAVTAREKMISTGIGRGVAIPHAPAEGIDDYFIITGITRAPVAWQAIDGQPVTLIFLLGIPQRVYGQAEEARKYLHITSRLMMLIKNEDRHRRLLEADTVRQVFAVLKEKNFSPGRPTGEKGTADEAFSFP